MKKFLAVLLAVALLGVAGAAFAADDGGHAGHGSSSAIEIVTFTPEQLTTMSADAYIKEENVTGTTSYSGEYGVALVMLTGLENGKTYVFKFSSSAISALTALEDEIVNGSLKLYDRKNTSSAVALAGEAKNGKFCDKDYSDTTDPSDAVYAVFTAAAGDAELYAEGTKNPDGPTSNKGSGGCNAGFAGLAVLALSALALRRKAR